MPYILALDEGTSSARSIIFDHNAREIAMHQVPIACQFPNDGWVEQDAEEIWLSQLSATHQVIAKAGISISEITAIGIANQRETTIVWDRHTGKAISPAIVWQCRRTNEICRQLLKDGHGPQINESTGLVIDPYFSATKIAWILDNVSGARERAQKGDLVFGTVDSWLIYKLTGGRSHLTDYSNASRTMLLELHKGSWDDNLFQLLDIPTAMRPRVIPSSGVATTTDATILGAEIPIAGIVGDQQSALFGQMCFRKGFLKNTYGTGSFVLLHTGTKAVASNHKLLPTMTAVVSEQREYALEGSIFAAGATVKWLRDSLGILKTASQSDEVASSIADSAGVYLVPAFTGLGAPHWDSSARGVITGLTRSSSKAHIVRAALEAIAYQTRELVEAMESDTGTPLIEVRADGGAAANNFLMQFQADILGKPVVRPSYTETTALGSAFLAGLGTDIWQGTADLEGFWQVGRRFEPQMTAKHREDLFQGWKCALEKAKI